MNTNKWVAYESNGIALCEYQKHDVYIRKGYKLLNSA